MQGYLPVLHDLEPPKLEVSCLQDESSTELNDFLFSQTSTIWKPYVWIQPHLSHLQVIPAAVYHYNEDAIIGRLMTNRSHIVRSAALGPSAFDRLYRSVYF